MSAWIVYSKDGKTQRCELKRLEYSGSHMGERAVTATFEHHSEVAFDVFDYIVYRGEKFELESIPSVKKVSRNEYKYELRFVSLKYELERCEMRDIVPNDNGVVYPTPLTFSFTGDVRYLSERIQANLDALYGKGVWNIVVAEGVSSDEKNISIAQQNCWNALSLVNTTYGLNFSVRGREVVIGGEIDAVSHTFQYGKGNGLYEIERASDTEIGIVTKLRAYGSTKNLDYSYPKKPEWADSALPVSFALSPLRLMLPSFKEDGKTDYVLADDAVISKYGIREASIVYEDIYPSIAGATNENGEAIDEIASVDEIDESKSTFVVYLRDLGFDLEEHLTTSEAQLSMKTGTLQGYTFNISVIDRLSNGGYKLTLGRNSVEGSEESGFNVPNKDWNMKAGDKFVLLNILMPQAYIREAEQRLLIRAKEYLAEYGKTNFSYNVGLHDKFLVEHPGVYDSLVEGVKLRVQDNELGISEDVIIQSITITEASDDNILPQVKVTLNNKPSASTLDRIQGKLNDVIAETSANNFSSQNELMAQYRKKLDKPFFDKLFSAVDANGNEIASNDVSTPVAYIKAKYDVLVLGGVTMYGNDESLDLPTLAEGLPFDQRTIWFNPETKQIEVIGGTGGGVADSVLWDNVEGKPSWITNTKPTYSYSEIQGTPDLSGYATTSSLNAVSTKLNDFLEGSDTDTVINKWKELETFLSGLTESDNLATILTGKADKSYVDTNFVTISGTEDVTGLHNFVNGLKVGGLPITKKQDDVVYLDANLVVRGGITMYAENEVNIPSILDSLPIASTSALGIAKFDSTYFSVDSNGMVSLTSAPSSGASTLGELLNVDSSIDATASVDRVLYQPAGSAMWVSKPLDEIMIGGGGGVTNGEAYKVYEQAMTSNIDVLGAYKGLQLFFNVSNSSIGTVGAYDAVLHVAGSSRGFQLRSVKDSTDFYVRNVKTNGFTDWNKILHSGNYSSYALPLSGGKLSGTLYLNNNVSISGYVNNVSYDIFRINENNHLLVGYGHAPDGNTSIYGNNVYLRNGANREYALTALANGNVGIGTTSPNSKLDVNSDSIEIGKSVYGTGGVSAQLFMSSYREGSNQCARGLKMYISATEYGVFQKFAIQSKNYSTLQQLIAIDSSGNLNVTGGVTMYSDQRKKTILNHVELSLKQIADAPLIEHYYNSDQEKTTHVGSIAQYWASMNDWFCKLDNEGFYTMEIQNCALASAISIARHLEKYESKTDKTIRKMKKRIQELEEEVERLKQN